MEGFVIPLTILFSAISLVGLVLLSPAYRVGTAVAKTTTTVPGDRLKLHRVRARVMCPSVFAYQGLAGTVWLHTMPAIRFRVHCVVGQATFLLTAYKLAALLKTSLA